MRPLLHPSTKAITALYNYRLLANAYGDPIPKTIDHVITKVGGAILVPGDLRISNNLSGALKLNYSQNFFFAYLNKEPFLTQSLTHLSMFKAN